MSESTHSTFSNQNTKINIDELKKACDMILKNEDTSNEKLHKIPFLDRMMAKLGWHRKYEILIVDKEKLNRMMFSGIDFHF